MIHGTVHPLENFKVINYFGTRYAEISTFKEGGQDPIGDKN